MVAWSTYAGARAPWSLAQTSIALWSLDCHKSLTNVCTFGLTALQGGHLHCHFVDKDMAVHEDEMIDPVILQAEGRSRNQGLQARVFSTLASLKMGSESLFSRLNEAPVIFGHCGMDMKSEA